MTDRTAFLNYREQKTAFLDVPDLTALDGTPLHAALGSRYSTSSARLAAASYYC